MSNINHENRCAVSGKVYPHAGLMSMPPDGQLLYKIMTTEHLVRSIRGGYLHFNRVDCYSDFPGADPHDGQQPPRDELVNGTKHFQYDPDSNLKQYYDKSRSRTYACCFSLQDSGYIWREYGNSDRPGKVGVVFDLNKLRATLEETHRDVVVSYGGVKTMQIFDLNCGMVNYIDWNKFQANEHEIPNPIIYSYLKDRRYKQDKELRFTLSALGVGRYQVIAGQDLLFPPSISYPFDFQKAALDGTIQRLIFEDGVDPNSYLRKLSKVGCVPAEGSDI